MKFPKKCFGMAAAVFAIAVVTSATALAKPATTQKVELPGYFSAAADLGNTAYLACIRSHVKSPASANILVNFDATLTCQKDPKS